MKKDFPDGIWPTMITPFMKSGFIDYSALTNLIEWYIKNKVDGLFAVCQSSEMFFLSLEERVKLAEFVKEKAGNRVPVISSGHVSDSFEDQVRELNMLAETGVDAVVLITNRLAAAEESDSIWLNNLEKLLKKIPEDIALGFYECPFPYKRIISPSLLKWSADTKRFFFLKDTSCDVMNIKEKFRAVEATGLKIYNANSASLLETLKLGVAGYSGVMANFHPNLYAWLVKNWKKKPDEAKKLMNFLSLASQIEKQLYPVNAKFNLMLEGVLSNYYSRSKDHMDFTATNKLEIEQLYELSKEYSYNYPV